MYEYKVFTTFVRDATKKLNEYAQEGWRLVKILPDWVKGAGHVMVMEREKAE